VPIFSGAVQNASYRDQLVGRYNGNPAIEALPPILSAEKAAKMLAYYPERQPGGERLPPEIRMHLIMDAMHFFEPLQVHIDLEQRLSRVIRDGYVGRNPVARDHWHEIDQRVETILKPGRIPLRTSNVLGFSIVGMPGIGKTTGVERILQTYPQVIHHHAYGGRAFSRIQLVWVKLTCPHDGSIKGLCLDFLREVDGVLRTNHYRAYGGGGRRTVDDLIPSMCRVAWIHCLGLLVIDEIQHLNQAKSGGAEQMLNFFLQLMNTLGVPVVLIGTYGAMHILGRELRQVRRSSGQGDLIWDRMANDEVWRLFTESLWRYQYTKSQVPLSQEWSDVLHHESAGIIDFAVKLFLLAQVRAISTGIEKITTAILGSVAKDSLRLAQPALRAIRTGDMRAVSTMTDLHPIDFQSAAHEIRKAALLRDLSSGSQVVSDINAATAVSAASEPAAPTTAPGEDAKLAPAHSAKSSAKPGRTKKAADPSKCLLVQIANAGLARNTSAHDALAQAGLIKPLFNIQARGLMRAGAEFLGTEGGT
jgi:hypothetical protein